MRCHVERGYGNLTPCGSTLWVRVKRHAIHHRGSSMHRRLVENILLVTGRICAFDLQAGHNILLVFGLTIMWHLRVMYVIDQCWPECGVLVSSTSYSGFCLSLVQLIAWAEDTCIGLTLNLFIVSSTLGSLFSPSDENKQLKLLEKSLS